MGRDTYRSAGMETERGRVKTLRPRQNGCHFPDDIFTYIFLNENVCTSLTISLKFVPKVRINNIPALVQIMAWRRPGDKPLSEPMMVNSQTHICVTLPQWVKTQPGPSSFSQKTKLRKFQLTRTNYQLIFSILTLRHVLFLLLHRYMLYQAQCMYFVLTHWPMGDLNEIVVIDGWGV